MNETEDKPKVCDFCATSDKAHNVCEKAEVLNPKRKHILCDNPVCNAIPGGVYETELPNDFQSEGFSNKIKGL